ncbi:MAG: hypothetical protein J5934_03545 [Succinivibrio sp.]|nr:hypothetical protein [Succinivibrio sp.]
MKISLESYLVKDKISLADISTKADPKVKREDAESKMFPEITREICTLQEKLWAKINMGLLFFFRGWTPKERTVRLKEYSLR